MRTRGTLYLGRAVGIALFLAATLVGITAAQPAPPAVAIDSDDIGGRVTSANGPEAGVWVIAETSDLPTKFVRIVVTDDQGRYLLPDLPTAGYKVWVRGYGLVDSPKVDASPGRNLDLTAVTAPSLQAAADYYPAGYWFSMLQVPAKSEFPGTGPDGNGISTSMQSQAQWVRLLKTGPSSCTGSCHLIGTKITREGPQELGYDNAYDAWEHRTQRGQNGADMIGTLNQMGPQRALREFAAWTDRITGGEVPMAPDRPKGVERNIVITQWDWAEATGYLHDEVSTDKRNPTTNGYGLIYGSMEFSKDYSPVLDPVRNTVSRLPLTVQDPATQPAAPQGMVEPWRYWGDENIWNARTNTHNPMLDDTGRVWFTSVIRPPETPDFCREGSNNPSAQLFPMNRAGRQLAVYDPSTGETTHVDTCFGTHHVVFAEDVDNTAWTSGGGEVIGWLNTRKYLETGDEAGSQGWAPLILDTNGNGQPDAYVEPDQAIDPELDKRISVSPYGIAVSPLDGSVWVSHYSNFPGGLVRLAPGDNPPATSLAELFEVPWNQPGIPNVGFSPRGMDIDRNGVVWTPLASGHLASFDRSKCQAPLNGPNATGQHCPEGWIFYPEPMPPLRGVEDPGTSGASYYTWVDQFNTFGLGANVPINTGNAAEALLALKDGQWVQLRVPYPMGFFTKWMDGRIDDPNAGWKGRGLFATIAARPVWQMETGKDTLPKVMHFQLRPDPLAK